MIYLDHNASTPLRAEVLEAMMPYLATNFANPSSVHQVGRIARNAIDIAREQVAALVNAHPSQVVFTSGGTEANNLAINGCVQGMGLSRLATGATEHPSVRQVAKNLATVVQCLELDVDRAGLIDFNKLKQWAEGSFPGLASIMLANNETGVIQDVSAFGDFLQKSGCFLHSDVSQAVGKIAVDFTTLNASLLTFSSHKIYGPKGAGALVFDKSIDLMPMSFGGGQEKSLRSGTENVAAIVGFGEAAALVCAELDSYQRSMLTLQNYFEEKLKCLAGVTVFAPDAPRLSNTTFFSISGIDGETLLMQLDLNGIAVTSGSACASKDMQPSHVLIAMGIDELLARGAIRVSFGTQNTIAEVDQLIEVLQMQLDMIASLEILDS